MLDERSTSADGVTALEKALTGFADRDSDSVVTPSVGLSFDSINEAYEFYNLYSWESGFGVRYAKSRTNVKGTNTCSSSSSAARYESYKQVFTV